MPLRRSSSCWITCDRRQSYQGLSWIFLGRIDFRAEGLGRSKFTTVFMTLFGAFTVLTRYTQQEIRD
jgi:hypothetical protein